MAFLWSLDGVADLYEIEMTKSRSEINDGDVTVIAG